MAELNATVHIRAPVEEVFAFVDDWRNVPRFLRGLVRWEPVDPERTQGLGIRFNAALRAGPATLEGEMEVTEHVPGKRVAYRSVRGPRIEGRWMFHRDGDDATLVELRNSYEPPGGITGRLVASLARSQGQRDLEASLADLKRLIEEGG